MRVALDGGRGAARFVIDDEVVTWEGAQVEPTGDAALTLALLPALVLGDRVLEIDAPVDPALLDRVPALTEVLVRWFVPERTAPLEVVCQRAPTATRRPPARTALAFSGGVDSFFTALTREPPVTDLVFVLGFDVNNAAEEALITPRIQQAAEDLGLPLHIVRTNTRLWSWDKVHYLAYHGPALAALGHVLPDIGTFVMADSLHETERDDPWGSHPDLDPMWSSSRVTIDTHGASSTRPEKVRAVAAHPAVRAHLRVCVKNRGGLYNCGRCEKCLRTMTVLAASGDLPHIESLPASISPRDIHRLPRITGGTRVSARETIDDLRRSGAEPRLARAIERRLRHGGWRAVARRIKHRLKSTEPRYAQEGVPGMPARWV